MCLSIIIFLKYFVLFLVDIKHTAPHTVWLLLNTTLLHQYDIYSTASQGRLSVYFLLYLVKASYMISALPGCRINNILVAAYGGSRVVSNSIQTVWGAVSILTMHCTFLDYVLKVHFGNFILKTRINTIFRIYGLFHTDCKSSLLIFSH